MSRRRFLRLAAGVGAMIGAGLFGFKLFLQSKERVELNMVEVKLSIPEITGKMSVEEALQSRRSRRSYSQEPILLSEISQLCWAAQGITEKTRSLRAAPSAGALYPIEILLVVGNSELEEGIYQYIPATHTLMLKKRGDYRPGLCEASLDQKCIENAPVNFIIVGVFNRTEAKYGERGRERYVFMEAGHVAENIYLQAESLALSTVSIGAFYDDNIREVISLPKEYTPIYIMPIGRR